MFAELNDLKHLDPKEFDARLAVLAEKQLKAQLEAARKFKASQKKAKAKATAKKSGK